jgi:hypothetical protein
MAAIRAPYPRRATRQGFVIGIVVGICGTLAVLIFASTRDDAVMKRPRPS